MAPSVAHVGAASDGTSLWMSAAPFCLLLPRLGVVGLFLELIVNEPEWQTQQLAKKEERKKNKQQKKGSPSQTPSAATDAHVAPGTESGHKGVVAELFSFAIFIVRVAVFPLFLKPPRCRPRRGAVRCHGGDDGLCLAGCESIRCAGSTAAE